MTGPGIEWAECGRCFDHNDGGPAREGPNVVDISTTMTGPTALRHWLEDTPE